MVPAAARLGETGGERWTEEKDGVYYISPFFWFWFFVGHETRGGKDATILMNGESANTSRLDGASQDVDMSVGMESTKTPPGGEWTETAQH